MLDLTGLNPFYKILIFTIIIVKVIYLIIVVCTQLAGFGIYFDKSKEKKFVEGKERVENLYFFLMSIMLIFVFYTRHARKLKYIERELFHFFGWVLGYALFTKFMNRRKKLKNQNKNSTDKDETEDLVSEIIEFTIPVDIFK